MKNSFPGRSRTFMVLITALFFTGTACMNRTPGQADNATYIQADTASAAAKGTEMATFSMGCFWHSEEMFSELKGVVKAVPGYAGGTAKDPSYEEVSTGTTGYAESVNVTFDPAVISYEQLLKVFFAEHDPTTPNMAYPDEGPQYRSAIFYRNPQQKTEAENYIRQLTEAKKYTAPIITQVSPFTTFYQAEAYHLHYYRKHPDEGYIASVTRPEIEKFRKDFKDWLK